MRTSAKLHRGDADRDGDDAGDVDGGERTEGDRTPSPQAGRPREDGRARHRLGKWLLRRRLHFAGCKNWTKAHRTWIDGPRWTHTAERVVAEDYLLAIDPLEARLIALDARLGDIAQSDPYREPVGWLRCFRGIALDGDDGAGGAA